MTAADAEMTAADLYPRFESVADNFGNTFRGPADVTSHDYVVIPQPTQTLHPGDVVTFTCVATDPNNRPLRLRLRVIANPAMKQEAVSNDGSPVELTWQVGKNDVSLKTWVKIDLRTDSAEYHRFGRLGDQSVTYGYRVDQPPS